MSQYTKYIAFLPLNQDLLVIIVNYKIFSHISHN